MVISLGLSYICGKKRSRWFCRVNLMLSLSGLVLCKDFTTTFKYTRTLSVLLLGQFLMSQYFKKNKPIPFTLYIKHWREIDISSVPEIHRTRSFSYDDSGRTSTFLLMLSPWAPMGNSLTGKNTLESIHLPVGPSRMGSSASSSFQPLERPR